LYTSSCGIGTEHNIILYHCIKYILSMYTAGVYYNNQRFSRTILISITFVLPLCILRTRCWTSAMFDFAHAHMCAPNPTQRGWEMRMWDITYYYYYIHIRCRCVARESQFWRSCSFNRTRTNRMYNNNWV